MRILKWILIGLGFLFLLPFFGAGALYLTDPPYYGRYFSSFMIDPVRDVDWYAPLERVAGNPGPTLPRAAETERTISESAWQEAVAYAKDMQSTALIVWHDGAVQYEFYDDGYDGASLVETASMHKSVVALLVGAAIADGTIPSVDEPAATYLTEWADDDRSNVTIRHLLTMTSGMYREPFSLSPFSESRKMNLAAGVEGLTLKQPVRQLPGEEFDYNNNNPQALGILLERATGQSYAEVLSAKLWSKLGTNDAFVWLDEEGGLARTFCCLQAGSEDWMRVGLLHLNKGRVGDVQVLPEAWMEAVATGTAAGPNYGYLTWLGSPYMPRRDYGPYVATFVRHNEPYIADDVVFFDGAGGQRVYVIPSYEMVIVRTGTGGIDFAEGTFTWEDSVIPNALMRGVQSDR